MVGAELPKTASMTRVNVFLAKPDFELICKGDGWTVAKAAVRVNMSGGSMKMMRGRIIHSGKTCSRKTAAAVSNDPSMTAIAEMTRSGWNSTHTSRGRMARADGNELNQLEKVSGNEEKEDWARLKIKITMKSLRVQVRNHAAYLSWRSEWLSHSLKKRGSVKRDAAGLKRRERQQTASKRRGIR